jgi:hypothetical protein
MNIDDMVERPQALGAANELMSSCNPGVTPREVNAQKRRSFERIRRHRHLSEEDQMIKAGFIRERYG